MMFGRLSGNFAGLDFRKVLQLMVDEAGLPRVETRCKGVAVGARGAAVDCSGSSVCH